jgi:hypothetical protein
MGERPAHRDWLRESFGVEIVTLAGLSAKIAVMSGTV